MAKIEDIERRLQNWARWRLGADGGPLSHAGVNWDAMQGGGVREPYADAPVPTSAVEAAETQDAVARLETVLRFSVEVYYLEGGGDRHKLNRLCCTARTMHDRIDRAHRVLAGYFADRQERARLERARVEALQRSMRPVAP
jgi:hypothetical protein